MQRGLSAIAELLVYYIVPNLVQILIRGRDMRRTRSFTIAAADGIFLLPVPVLTRGIVGGHIMHQPVELTPAQSSNASVTEIQRVGLAAWPIYRDRSQS